MISILACLKTSLIDTEPCNAVGSESDCRSKDHKFHPGLSHAFVEIDHEIISMVILLLIQEVTNESMCRKYWLTP